MKKAKLTVELVGQKFNNAFYGKCQNNIKTEFVIKYEKLSDKLYRPKNNLKCVFLDENGRNIIISLDKEYACGTYQKDGFGEDFSAAFNIGDTGYELQVYLNEGVITSINLKEYDSLEDYFDGNEVYTTLELISYQYGRQKFNV